MADILCSVLSVKPYSGYYPACPKCIRKLKRIHTNTTEHQIQQETASNLARFVCKFCVCNYSLEHIIWNYCIALTITDGRVVSDVVTFGSRLNSIFGMTALELHKFLLSEFSLASSCLPLQDPYVSGYVIQAISAVVTGKIFKFRFKLPNNGAALPSSLYEVCKNAAGGSVGEGGLPGGPVKGSLQRVTSVIAIYFEPMQTAQESVSIAMALRSVLMNKENAVSPYSLCTVPRPDSEPRPFTDIRPHPLTYYDQFDQSDSCSSVITTPINFNSYVAGDSLVKERSSFVKEEINKGSLNQETSLEDSSSVIDYKQLLDELQEDWLLTQPDSCTPILPDSCTLCISPFWNNVPSTQAILQRNNETSKDVSESPPRQGFKPMASSTKSPDTIVNSTSIDQGSAISGNTTFNQCSFGMSSLPASFFSDTGTSSPSNFVTPKLKKTASKRQLLTTMPRPPQSHLSHTPSEFGFPNASSTPSISLQKAKTKFVNPSGSNNTEYGLSPDLL